jgi:hypothetical protein
VINAPSAQPFRHEELLMFPLPTLCHVSPQDDHGFFSMVNVVTGFATVKRHAKGMRRVKMVIFSGNNITDTASASNIAAQQI